jgi:uncharacterized protein
MARKKVQKKQDTALVPHRTANLSVLLARAKAGASAAAVRAYLAAGGTPVAVLKVQAVIGELQLPLLHYMAMCNVHPHTELAESVRLLVAAGADINATAGPEGDDGTALMRTSVKKCCTKVLQALLENGADVFACSSKGTTALHKAAALDRTDSCEVLLHSNASLVHVTDVDGFTALVYAVRFGSVETATVLQQHGADINTTDLYGMTPLMIVSEVKRVDVVVHLLKHGAHVNAVDSEGISALIRAVNINSIPIVQLLLNHGADIQVTDILGQNALFTAVREGHVFMMDMLVKCGLSITAVDNKDNTLLMLAVSRGHAAAVEWLLQHGVAVNAANNDGVTALHTASGSNRKDDAAMIELLLANGADVDIRTTHDDTALYIAAYHGNVECARALIAAGTEVNHINKLGLNSLQRAVLGQHSAVVQLLIEHGATAVINSVVPMMCLYGDCRCTGISALMLCTTVDTVKVLLAAGADVHMTTDAGDTCLHVAVKHELPVPVICLLIKAGVNLHAVNNEGKTAAQIAHTQEDDLVEKLLIRAAQQQQH